jgi:hypothetical protein
VLRSLSSYLPNQPGYHKRLKTAQPLLGLAIGVLAELVCTGGGMPHMWCLAQLDHRPDQQKIAGRLRSLNTNFTESTI